MNDLANRVDQSICARRLLDRGQRILIAVSGGVDSMVLLRVLSELAAKYGWQLSVAHVNHRLRGRSSDADERLVRLTARTLNLPVLVERADVRQFARTHNLSIEMAARKVRHDFLARTASQLGIRSVALAHHADDQLELFFLRLLRGSGGEGLAGMKWRNRSPSDPKIELVRPLLDHPKSTLHDYASEKQVRFREDATNALLDIQRNRIRHELLPLLRKEYQPALDKTVLRTMEIVAAEADCVTQAALQWLDRGGKRQSGGWNIEDRGMDEIRGERNRPIRPHPSTLFDELPVAVQRRSLQLQLLRQGVVADYDLLEQLRSAANRAVSIGPWHSGMMHPAGIRRFMVRGSEGQGNPGSGDGRRVEPPSLLQAIRDCLGVVTLQEPTSEEFRSDEIEVNLGERAGEVVFDGAVMRWRVDIKRPVRRPQRRVGREFFDADRVGSCIWLRHWRPGDRFQPIGMACAVKLQDFFTNGKVPRRRRRDLIVAATAKGEVFWVEGMRISERFKLTEQTIRRLQWRWNRA